MVFHLIRTKYGNYSILLAPENQTTPSRHSNLGAKPAPALVIPTVLGRPIVIKLSLHCVCQAETGVNMEPIVNLHPKHPNIPRAGPVFHISLFSLLWLFLFWLKETLNWLDSELYRRVVINSAVGLHVSFLGSVILYWNQSNLLLNDVEVGNKTFPFQITHYNVVQ